MESIIRTNNETPYSLARFKQLVERTDPDLEPIFLITGENNKRYRLLKILGEGGNGIVFLALHDVDKFIAVKMRGKLLKGKSIFKNIEKKKGADYRVYFLEPKKEKACIHCFFKGGIKEENRAPFESAVHLSFWEYAEGILEDKKDAPFKEKFVYFKQFLRGLKLFHDHAYVHADIKPANLFFVKEGLKIGDFDSSLQEAELGESRKLRGTPGYMAPEMFDEKEKPSTKIDIFSAGITFAGFFSGKEAPPAQHLKNPGRQQLARYLQVPRQMFAADTVEIVTHTYTALIYYRRVLLEAIESGKLDKFSAYIYGDVLLPMMDADPRKRPNVDALLQRIEQAEKSENFSSKNRDKDPGKKPFPPQGISKESAHLIIKYLEKNRGKDIQNMDEVLDALAALRESKRRQRQRRWQWTAAMMVVLFLTVVMLTMQPWKRSPAGSRESGVKIASRQAETPEGTPPADGEGIESSQGTFTGDGEGIDSPPGMEEEDPAVRAEKEYNRFLTTAAEYLERGNIEKAIEYLNRAKEIKHTPAIAQFEKEIKQLDDRAFESAYERNTISALRFYLDKYPYGRHRAAAQARMEKLRRMPAEVRAVLSKAVEVARNKQGFWEAYYGRGIVMVYIPAGEFSLGPIRSHKVYMDGYWIGRTEVTNSQYVEFLNDVAQELVIDAKGDRVKYHGQYIFDIYCGSKKGGCLPFTEMISHSRWEYRGKRFRVVPGYEKHPVVLVTWYGAVEYCNWLSKETGVIFQLPTEARWEKAARGVDGRKYPWGNHGPYYNGVIYANYNPGIYEEDGFRCTAPVGSFPHGASPYGVLDMAGNVWEWCSDWYAAVDYYSRAPRQNPAGPTRGTQRVTRGGSWDLGSKNIQCTVRGYLAPEFRGFSQGFRLSMAAH